MFSKSNLSLALLAVLSLSGSPALGRERILERDGRAIYPRRFGQENPAVIGKIGGACRGEVCGVLGGRAIGTLLALSPECAQQDLADDIIDASKNEDPATAANMVALAIEFRQAEKNTPPDFTTNPPTARNSVFCQKAPRNPELNGLVQAQDPANDPDIFFDPALKASVRRGSQPNTAPFGGAAAPPAAEPAATESAAATETAAATAAPTAVETAAPTDACPVPVTVTVTVGAEASATATAPAQVETAAPPAETTAAPAAPPAGALNFGTCTDPTIEFGPAFEGRKLRENTFKPVNKNEFPQGSALNFNIVTTAVCNILATRCNAPADTNTACQAGIAAAVAAPAGGAKADAFNAALGITTTFATVPAAPGGGPGNPALVGKADFNLCSPPTIAFGIFDGRTENSFAPENRQDYPQGSALNPAIVAKANCDNLVNRCDANQQAIDDCAAAIVASQGLTGQAFADAFNARVTQNQI